MKRTSASGPPTRSQKRAIALATVGFIAVSAALHAILGGTFHPVAPFVAPAPTITGLAWSRLESPPPSPRPSPTPRLTPPPAASPTPQPRRIAATASPLEHRTTQAQSASAPPQAIVLPSAIATSADDAAGEQSPEPSVVTAPATPADFQYVIVSARFLHQVRPTYPPSAIETGEEGTVIILIAIGPSGVSEMHVWQSSGFPDLDRAALEAAKESTYSVPEVNGQPATETYRVIYTFSLGS